MLLCWLTMQVKAQNILQIGEQGGEEATALVSHDQYWIAGGIFQQNLLGNNSRGQFDIWLHQYDSLGVLQWDYYIGSRRNEVLEDIALHQQTGDWYATGTFSDSLHVGTDTVLYSNNNTIFVTKHNQLGQLHWAKKIASNNLVRVRDIVVDDAGNSYLTGSFRDTLQADMLTLTHNGVDDAVFVLKLDTAGKAVWGAMSSLATEATGVALAIDPQGQVYLAGEFSSFLSLVGDTLLAGWVDADIFLAKLDENGNWLWQRQYAGSYPDEVVALLYQQEKLYLGGNFEGVLSLDDNQPLVTAVRAYDAFVAQLDTFGTAIWAKQTQSQSNCLLRDLVIKSNQLVAVGFFESQFNWQSLQDNATDGTEVFQLTLSTDGQKAALTTLKGGGNDIANACAIANNEKIGVVGSFQQQLNYSNQSINAIGFADAFLYWQDPVNLNVAVPFLSSTPTDIITFPNPTTQLIYLKTTLDLVEWKLYASNARQILQGQTQIVNLQDLPNGIYYITVFTTTKKQTFKIVKQD